MTVADLGKWLLMAYRLPREPSTPRIAVWRKLKRLGVAQLLDGMAALPLDSRNREQLEWLAEEILEAKGEASIWISEPTTAAQERTLASSMADSIAKEYRAVAEEAHRVGSDDTASRRRKLSSLRREMRRIRARDYFPPPERQEARAAVEQLASLVEVEA